MLRHHGVPNMSHLLHVLINGSLSQRFRNLVHTVGMVSPIVFDSVVLGRGYH